MRRRSEGFLPGLPKHEELMKPRFSTIEEIATKPKSARSEEHLLSGLRSPTATSRKSSVDTTPAKNPLERLETVIAARQQQGDSDIMTAKPLAEILHNTDGSITFQYKPVDIGTHELKAIFNDHGVTGTPFRCHVDKVESNYLIAYGPGLLTGSVGNETGFEIVGGAESDVDVTITGPVKPTVHRTTSGSVTKVNYLPLSPGEFTISILYKKKHIHGSPFVVKITGEGRKKSKLLINATSEVSLGLDAIDLTNVISVLKNPSSDKEPCLLVVLPDGKLGVANFIPHSRGTYEVEVTRDDEHVHGSPFAIPVGESELCAASKVEVAGDTKKVTAGQWNAITFDISAAGYGTLAISIDGDYRSDMKYTHDRHVYTIQYRPHEPGTYMMNVLFGDDHVPGSPFILNVGGEPSGKQRAVVSKDINAVLAAQPGTKCQLLVKVPGTSCLDMEAVVVSPEGATDECEIMGMDDCVHDVKFMPDEDGVYVISLKHKGLHVAGSPFQYTVGKVPSGGSHKVQCGGAGLEKGETATKNEFNIYTREAGEGSLSIGVEGPGKADINLVEQASGFWVAGYTVTDAGTYHVGVKWNGEHVRQSPFTVTILQQNKEAKLVAVEGLRDRGTEVGKAITFNANLNGARGTLTSKVKTPTDQVKDVAVQEMDRDLYALRFVPTENGVHYVSVMLNEADTTGSPFALLVGKLNADPGLVHASGDGLFKAETGSMAKFKVSTVHSGAGPLGVWIEGPSRVPIMCVEEGEGYDFVYTPTLPGDYYITIKYCCLAIAGCPYKAVVTGRGRKSDYTQTSSLVIEATEKKPGQSKIKRFTGDASKVQAAGPGLKKAFINKPSNFTIDVKNAGTAALAVSMISPTGQLVEELGYKLQKATIYQVNYKTKEKGDHVLHVLWGTDEVPGSPFIVNSG